MTLMNTNKGNIIITDGSCTKECAEYIEELMNNENNRGGEMEDSY